MRETDHPAAETIQLEEWGDRKVKAINLVALEDYLNYLGWLQTKL